MRKAAMAVQAGTPMAVNGEAPAARKTVGVNTAPSFVFHIHPSYHKRDGRPSEQTNKRTAVHVAFESISVG